MKIKTAELTGAALDWAVGNAANIFEPEGWYSGARVVNGKLHLLSETGDVFNEPYMPSTSWAQGGLIIELKKIDVTFDHSYQRWFAEMRVVVNGLDYSPTAKSGATPLIAAMRCFAASEYGEEVDVPEELVA